jgi:hypothetical protein
MQEELKNISNKLDIIIKLLVHQAISEKNAIDATAFLNQLGMPNKQISTILNIEPNIVGARLSKAKGKKTK